jgi:glucokinase
LDVVNSTSEMRIATENEKRIVGILATKGPMSKKDLSNLGEMAWATVVKHVNRLQEGGVLARVGTAPRGHQAGKNSYLYDLADGAPKFVGIDVEYRTTRVALVSLRREILWQTQVPTPAVRDSNELVDFVSRELLTRAYHSAKVGIENQNRKQQQIAGIGIGMPRWLAPGSGATFQHVETELNRHAEIPVRVENNIRAYTLHKELALQRKDFVVVSIRNGIGAGIFVDGVLLRGAAGLAGEIGHINVVDGGVRCRCGKRGCLETVVNQDLLYERFLSEVNADARRPTLSVEHGLRALFDMAAEGDQVARSILADAAKPIGRALASLVLVIDAGIIYLVGHFGSSGNAWIDPIKQVMRGEMGPQFDCQLKYQELDEDGYLLGAAMLVGRDFLKV